MTESATVRIIEDDSIGASLEDVPKSVGLRGSCVGLEFWRRSSGGWSPFHDG
jgi:hypothetical protein